MPLLSGLLLLSLLALLSGALGRRLLLWMRLEIADVAERGLVATALGLGALEFLPFALFALRVGSPDVFRVVLALLALALLPDSLAVLRAGGRWLREERRAWTGWQRGLIVLFALLLFAVLLRAVCPCTEGDALSYHLPPAQRYLAHGAFVYLPTITYTNWPMGGEILLTLLWSVDPSAPPGIVSYLLGVLLIATVALFARRLAGSFAAGVAVCSLLLLGDLFREMTTVMADVGLTAFCTLAIFALVRAETDATEGVAWERLAALFAGLTATMKLTGLWALLAIFIIYARNVLRQDRPSAAKRLLRFGLLSVCLPAPWFLKTWALTGNPFYPMLYNLFGGIEWTSTGWKRFQLAHLVFNTPPGYPPTPQTLMTTHAIYAVVGVALCAAILRATRHSRFATPLGVAALFLACICVGNYFNARFLLPVLPATLVCLAALLQARERVAAPLVGIAALVLAVQIGVFQLKPSLPTAAKVALGLTSRADYLRARLPLYDVSAFANAHLSPDARILLGGQSNLVALFHAEALWAIFNLQDSIHYDTPQRLEADLRRLHVGYLVLTPFPADCERNANCRLRRDAENAALHALARQRGTRLYAANGCVLYRLNLPSR